MNLQMKRELPEVINKTVNDSSKRVVVITGKGRGFCAGADLKDMWLLEGLAYRNTVREFQQSILEKIFGANQVFLAAVNGLAVGGGFSLALCCDMIIASEDAYFQSTFVKGPALIPDLGLGYLLPKIVGLNKAKELLIASRKISASQAKVLGLIAEVVPAEQLSAKVEEVAGELAALAPQTLALTKKIIHLGMEPVLPKYLNYEADFQALLRLTKDHQEGTKAFKEKRPPQFTGE
jgi:2-(1,2-epoxy-1,2-dihydrophenyl)acetyl-CoA isomerase